MDYSYPEDRFYLANSIKIQSIRDTPKPGRLPVKSKVDTPEPGACVLYSTVH